MKILFFIGSLEVGGKERRLIELLSFLNKKTNYNLIIVLRRDIIEYPKFNDLNLKTIIISKPYKKKDLTLHFKFLNICNKHKPDIIHTWGKMPAFISLLSVIFYHLPHINSQITDAPTQNRFFSINTIINWLNFQFSKVILSNSYAGLKAYGVESKINSMVIYNGVDYERFNIPESKTEIKANLGILSKYCVIMVASFTNNKDYCTYINIAKEFQKINSDTTFLAVGSGPNIDKCKEIVKTYKLNNFVFLGQRNDVEYILKACDVGIMISPNGEGFSNAIIEYMAMKLPVIANDLGGNRELIIDGRTGFLIDEISVSKFVDKLKKLLTDTGYKDNMIHNIEEIVASNYSIEKMGREFINVYNRSILLK